ncbi:hypothetical protein FV141_00020 [Dermacoccus abyssi]|uniref:Fibronectin type-III domain-containing protein n=1 Tax=Dermacoccus abyssi TaxID=322596 RepID=A0ABX5Z8P1_9MICO|nr:hypothetical protein FV141_00020 [Dermacoccus abyssi]
MLKAMFLSWRAAAIAATMAFLMVLGLGAAPIAAAAGAQKILIVGDSLTHGSSGDYSWRYWLWRNFASGTVDFVGPRSDLNNLVTQDGDDTSDHTYRVPGFDQDHAAKSGRTAGDGVNMLPGWMSTYKPDTVAMLLGINDISLGATGADVESRTRTMIGQARAANPSVKIAIGKLLPQADLSQNPDWEARRLDANKRIVTLVSQLTTSQSPISIADASLSIDPERDLWDRTHLGATGEVKVAKAFSEALARLGVGTAMTTLPVPTVLPVPSAPTLTAQAGNGAVTIHWNRPVNAWNFYIEVNHPGFGWSKFPIAMNTTSWTIDNLTNGANYQFRVTPVGKGGIGASSNVATATPTGPAPGSTTLNTTVDGKKVTLSWNHVANSTGVYIWMRDKTGDGVWVKSEWTIFDGWSPFEMPGTKAGADYEFKVQTANGIIPGDFSNVTVVHTSGPAPTAPKLTAKGPYSNAPDGNYVDLDWTVSTNATEYWVELRDATGNELWKQLPIPTWNNWFRAGYMVDGHTYEYRIFPRNDYVPGPRSNVVSVTIPKSSITSFGAKSKAAYTALTSTQLADMRRSLNLAKSVHPNDWFIPGSTGYRGLEERLRHDVYGSPSAKQIFDAIAPTIVSGVIALAGIAVCAESAGIGCAYTVSVLASLAGSCVEDCSNRNNLVLAAVAGGVPGMNRLPRYVDTMFDLPKSAPRLAARGSTGRYTVQSDAEYDAMFAVRSNPAGTVLPTAMGDSRWLGSEGWVKKWNKWSAESRSITTGEC